MIRTLLQHSKTLAGLSLAAALTVTVAQAQTPQNATIAGKPVRRVVETDKTRAQQPVGAPARTANIAVGEPTGIRRGNANEKLNETEQKLRRRLEEEKIKQKKQQEDKEAELKKRKVLELKAVEQDQLKAVRKRADEKKEATPATIAVGEPNGRAQGEKVIKLEGGPVRRTVDEPAQLPQRTKDAAGSPQRGKQKTEAGTVLTPIAVGEPNGPVQGGKVISGGEGRVRRTVDEVDPLPQRTKDATGSPQKAGQKGDKTIPELIRTPADRGQLKIEPQPTTEPTKELVVKKPIRDLKEASKESSELRRTVKETTELKKEPAKIKNKKNKKAEDEQSGLLLKRR